MIHLLATPMEVRRESHDQTPNRIKHDPEGTWDFGGSLNPLIALSNTDRYTGGSLELHIHYRIKAGWDVDSCAVFQCLTPTNVALRGVVNPIGGDVGHLGVSECGGQNDQPSVRVFVAEPTQDVHDVEILKARVYSPVGQVGWLRRLDDCHSLLAHSARTGVPTFTGSSEFLVLPLFGWDIPDGLPDDGKRHAPAIGRGDQRTGEVVQAGPKVVEEISCDEWNSAVRCLCENEVPLVLALLDGVASRVWVGVNKGLHQRFEPLEVALCPTGLFGVRRDDETHGLTLEAHGRGTEGTDAVHTEGPRNPDPDAGAGVR